MKLQLTALLRVNIADMLLVPEGRFPLSRTQRKILRAETPTHTLKALLRSANLRLRDQYVEIFRLAQPYIPVEIERKKRSLQGHHRDPGLVEKM